jgi:DNA-binding IclR family transcriptional regulator
MAAARDSKKAHTARRIVEILEFFDEQTRHATVMEIARRFDRPQSSTSELLSALVEMGLLYKHPQSRSFTPTPRAAMLGSIFQPSLVRDGRLSMAAERLTAETGLGAAILGMVGVDLQVFRWISGAPARPGADVNALRGGARAPLNASAAGWMMLSRLPLRRCDGVLHRLRAEAPPEERFDLPELRQRIFQCGRQGHATGPAGFGVEAEICAVLLPCGADDQAMALGAVYDPRQPPDLPLLVSRLRQAIDSCGGARQDDPLVPAGVQDIAGAPLLGWAS